MASFYVVCAHGASQLVAPFAKYVPNVDTGHRGEFK